MESPLHAFPAVWSPPLSARVGSQIYQFGMSQLPLNNTSDRPTLAGFDEWMTDGQFNSTLTAELEENPRSKTFKYLLWGYVAVFSVLFLMTFVQRADNRFRHHYRRFFLWPILSIILNVMLAFALCRNDHWRWYKRQLAQPIALRLTLERLNDTSIPGPLLLRDNQRWHETETWKEGYKWITRDVSRARALLNMLGSTSINVVVLTFSVTILAMQLFASNYSPRLVNSYMRSSANVRCLSVFIGFFAYCMTVIFFVGGEAPDEQEEDPFTPELAVNVLGLYSILFLWLLVFFMHNFLCGLHLQHILRNIVQENKRSLREANWSVEEGFCHWVMEITGWIKKSATSFKRQTIEPPRESDEIEPLDEFALGHRDIILAKRSGYICSADLHWLAHQLRKERPPLQLCVNRRIMMGTFVTEGTVLAWVRVHPDVDTSSLQAVASASDVKRVERVNKQQLHRVTRMVNRALRVSCEDRGGESISFGVREITEIAVRVMTSSVNDPHAAVSAIDRISELFKDIVRNKLHHHFVRIRGRLYVAMRSWSFEELLALCMHSLRFYCQKDLFVMERSIDMLADLGFICIRAKNGHSNTSIGSPPPSAAEFGRRLDVIQTHLDQLAADARSRYAHKGSTERRVIEEALERARDLMRDDQSRYLITRQTGMIWSLA
ncbi:unnamed protein product [Vitrella brassicaformis CCMP3155]|uniref:Uncharacterized protein n=1 Tax=Vitrella brassicaformis (strain CCMP3155) TaxID=1169540 RepID=A0A0G4FD42_VITBC|nr:unnamed protein product [Vitrella brassicaformis CCMP3155]|eukprot:CEM11071.1 unnamed protein product [Vitrella brassicaformis CCMP3155]